MNYQSVEEFYGIGKMFKKATKSVGSAATDLGKSTGITDNVINPTMNTVINPAIDKVIVPSYNGFVDEVVVPSYNTVIFPTVDAVVVDFPKDTNTFFNKDLPAGWSKEIQKPTDTFFNKDLDPSKNGLIKGWNKEIGNPFKNNIIDPAGKFLTKDMPNFFKNDFLNFFKSSWKWIVFVAAIIVIIMIIKFIT